jgi:uncharacterized protein YkwD
MAGRCTAVTSGEFIMAIETPLMRTRFSVRLLLLTCSLGLGLSTAARASDYASAISAYRHAHGLPKVRLDSRLSAVALKQAQAMAVTGSISHSAAGSFEFRVASLRKSRAAENIGAGYISFSEMLRQWEDSAGHRQNLLMSGARSVGVASVANARSPYRKFWAMVITD